MDRLLRPERFTSDPNEADSEKRYKHWKTTLVNYLSTTLTAPAATAGDEAIAAHNQKKFFGLQNSVSHTIYELISDCVDFDAAITTLDNIYIRPRSVIYNRHKLMTSKQEPLQSIDSFMQSLEQISKTCNFEAVTAEVNRKQYVRDAFINGISSSHIRQRLLESNTLTMDEAFQQARSLEQAQTQAATYESGGGLVAALHGNQSQGQHPSSVPPSLPTPTPQQQQQLLHQSTSEPISNHLGAVNHRRDSSGNSCTFCGRSRHARTQCPARNATCHTCQRKGHWSTVCRSSSTAGNSDGQRSNGHLGAMPDHLPHLT